MGINTHVLLEYGCLFIPSKDNLLHPEEPVRLEYEGENPAVDFLKTLQDRNDG